MFIIYDLIFLIIAVIYLPIYLFRRKFHRGFFLRFGILPKDLKLEQPIWVHAVSVGEAMAVRGLVGELKKAYPEKKFFISTVTSTGNKIAESMARGSDFVTYLPLDFSFIVKGVINKIKPSLLILAETEIWPNLISYLARLNIPIVIVNGRISDSSFRGYLSIKFLLKPILNKINSFCVQTQRDAQRLIRLGVSQDKIEITGNMKFDFKDCTDLKKDYTDYKRKLSLGADEKLLVAGSTHSGEEGIILNIYKKLLDEFSYLKLLLAPRHPERAKEVEKMVLKNGFRPLRISQLSGQKGIRAFGHSVFILDTIGQLMHYYAIADIVFVGGSLVKKGGHNILEPASLGKPILFGPHMFNFRDIAELFLKNQAAILVHNPEELKEKIKDLLINAEKTRKFSQRALELILENRGATQRDLKLIRNLYARISL